jgi:hypothetical protein
MSTTIDLAAETDALQERHDLTVEQIKRGLLADIEETDPLYDACGLNLSIIMTLLLNAGEWPSLEAVACFLSRGPYSRDVQDRADKALSVGDTDGSIRARLNGLIERNARLTSAQREDVREILVTTIGRCADAAWSAFVAADARADGQAAAAQ